MTLQIIKTSANVEKLLDTVSGTYVGYILTLPNDKGYSVYGEPHFFLKRFKEKTKAIDFAVDNLGSCCDDFDNYDNQESSDVEEARLTLRLMKG